MARTMACCAFSGSRVIAWLASKAGAVADGRCPAQPDAEPTRSLTCGPVSFVLLFFVHLGLVVNSSIALALCLLLLTASAQASSTLRCERQLISLQDYSAEVLDKCGEPISRDSLGYREILDDYGFRQEVKVEEWVYGPRNGMYHYLRFEGNRLVNIDSERGN
jgi:hypothetical protein